ncbi:hypothetical protein CPJ18_20610 [Agrobacterium rosae]|uniref:Uncharacterized protein n=1 Tax=Agrobacterium rosae TaxID=1972867 RepID=A0AAE5RUU7_9HYPH|nr:hypothetical protein DXM21_17540 [Agrobacterium rosae]KAA3517210.1 hypothetical protein DXM25_17590 [Agrobacterium rosae]MQB49938.1 hypothetical protein [Agrobacterium rosae]POO49600.1 hypothetical protein CPJ18_20610 [Agrobacterium rosae]
MAIVTVKGKVPARERRFQRGFCRDYIGWNILRTNQRRIAKVADSAFVHGNMWPVSVLSPTKS